MSRENEDAKGNGKDAKSKTCKRCGTRKGVIRKYRLGVCRRCFKEIAEQIGFRKYD